MPNPVAYLVLFAWPFVVLALMRVMTVERAAVAAVIGGYLLLPTKTGVDLPLIPAFNKALMPSLSFILVYLAVAPKRPARAVGGGPGAAPSSGANGWLPGSFIGAALVLMMIATPIGSMFGNAAPLFYGPTAIPGVSSYDGVSFAMRQAVVILPFLIGHKVLGDETGQRALLLGIVVAGLIYSIPMLVEVRLSPQLHTWIYGFFPHKFNQQFRGGGFRPVVFLSHGLVVAIFTAMAFTAALAAWRAATGRMRLRFAAASAWLFMMLVLCKSLGALAIAVAIGPAFRVVGRRLALFGLAAIAAAVLTYPMLRSADLVPVDRILEVASSYDAERGKSLALRIENEDELLERANLKPLFGWGPWGRSRIYDPFSGEDKSVSDGLWVITIGVGGWSGYVSQFGLLCLPVIILALRWRRYQPSMETIGLCAVLTVNLVDLLPNSGLNQISWLIAGALFGRLTAARRNRREASRRTRRSLRRGAGGEDETDAERRGAAAAEHRLAARPQL